MWILFALLSGLLYTIDNLVARHVLKANKDPWAFSFYFSLVGVVVTFPFFLADPVIPREASAWWLGLLIGVLIVANNLLIFKAANFLPASLSGALLKMRLMWIFLLGIVLLGTPFSWLKLTGTVLTIAAGVVIIRGLKKSASLPGVTFILAATIFNALIIVLFKPMLEDFGVGSGTFIVAFLIPAILNALIMPRALQRIKSLVRTDGRNLLIACAAGAFSNLALNKAISIGDVTSVVVISEAFVILLVVGEHFFMKEKESPILKICAVSLAVVGAILIQI